MQTPRTGIRVRRERGAALLVAIVCVSIAVAVMYGIVQLAVQGNREAGLEERRAQARWIVESGVDRAAARLDADREYSGEHWLLPAEMIGGRRDGEVRIEVERIEGQSNWRQVRVVADYPVDLPDRVRQTREFRMRLHP